MKTGLALLLLAILAAPTFTVWQARAAEPTGKQISWLPERPTFLNIIASDGEKICGGLNVTKSLKVSSGGVNPSVTLGIEEAPEGWVSVRPAVLPEIGDGQQGTFILLYSIPPQPGNYAIIYTATSEKSETQFTTILSVMKCELPKQRKDILLLELNSLRATAKWVLADVTQGKVKNQRSATGILQVAIDDLDEAEKSIKEGDSVTGEKLMEGARGWLEKAATEMSAVSVAQAPYLFFAASGIVTVIVSLMTGFYIRSWLSRRKAPLRAGGWEPYENRRRLLKKLMRRLEGH